MKVLIEKILRKCGLQITRYHVPENNETKCISIKPENRYKGSVLLSYIIEPFLLRAGESVSNAHTHDQESVQIAETFLTLGYAVDVIDYRNKIFVPHKDYSFFVSARTNFRRIAKLLNKDCIKIVHLETSHWLFNNSAAYKRCLELQQRRGISLKSFKEIEPNWAIENADFVTMKGNKFTAGTYAYAKKHIFQTSNPACVLFPSPENKNIENCRKNFLWLGSKGFVHKGLDLVLEAFTEMPDYQLTVCGPMHEEKAFVNAYHKELYQTNNIHTIGWIDISGKEFKEIKNNCIGLIYPSCAEGQAGAVVNCMQTGLIPVVSPESGVDIYDFGVLLKECSINEIKTTIKRISKLPAGELKKMAQKTWEYARTNHTREKFAEEYSEIIDSITKTHRKQDISMNQFNQTSMHMMKSAK